MIYSDYLSNQVLPNQSNKRITQNFFHRHVILNKQSSSPPINSWPKYSNNSTKATVNNSIIIVVEKYVQVITGILATFDGMDQDFFGIPSTKKPLVMLLKNQIYRDPGFHWPANTRSEKRSINIKRYAFYSTMTENDYTCKLIKK